MSLEQGDLFGTDLHANASQPPKKPYSIPSSPKAEEKPKAETPPISTSRYPLPKKNFTYSDHLKIHCGNKAAALYWYNEEQERFNRQ